MVLVPVSCHELLFVSLSCWSVALEVSMTVHIKQNEQLSNIYENQYVHDWLCFVVALFMCFTFVVALLFDVVVT